MSNFFEPRVAIVGKFGHVLTIFFNSCFIIINQPTLITVVNKRVTGEIRFLEVGKLIFELKLNDNDEIISDFLDLISMCLRLLCD